MKSNFFIVKKGAKTCCPGGLWILVSNHYTGTQMVQCNRCKRLAVSPRDADELKYTDGLHPDAWVQSTGYDVDDSDWRNWGMIEMGFDEYSKSLDHE